MNKTDNHNRRATLWIPLYGYRLTMSLGDSITKVAGHGSAGQEIDEVDVEALLTHHGNGATIQFQRSSLSPGVIAHEVFHATHRVMEWVENDLTRESHEPHAYLCQFITDWIYRKVLKDWKEKLMII